MFERPLRTTTISELVPLGPGAAVAALDVHRFEGVVAGCWAVYAPGTRLTFIGIPTRERYVAAGDALVVPVRIVMGRKDIVGRIELKPFSRCESELTFAFDATAGRRAVRWFDEHVQRVRPVLRALRDGLADAATRAERVPDLFADDTDDTLVA
jgi:hypothetical protein